MLRRTFCHLRGVGRATETLLWKLGVTSWDELLELPPEGAGGTLAQRLRPGVEESLVQVERRNAAYFTSTLPSRESWRLLGTFRDEVAYVDIETTGLDPGRDVITTIALYDGKSIRHYVRGDNLDRFAQDIRDYRVLVTYNGKCFDGPFIERHLGIELDHAHLDLRYILRALGYSGGLKGCERAMGLDRGNLADVDGLMAVALWDDYVREGATTSLETLLAYNIQDTVNLEILLVRAHNEMLAATPYRDELLIPDPAPPENPFQAHRETVERLHERFA